MESCTCYSSTIIATIKSKAGLGLDHCDTTKRGFSLFAFRHYAKANHYETVANSTGAIETDDAKPAKLVV